MQCTQCMQRPTMQAGLQWNTLDRALTHGCNFRVQRFKYHGPTHIAEQMHLKVNRSRSRLPDCVVIIVRTFTTVKCETRNFIEKMVIEMQLMESEWNGPSHTVHRSDVIEQVRNGRHKHARDTIVVTKIAIYLYIISTKSAEPQSPRPKHCEKSADNAAGMCAETQNCVFLTISVD